MIKREVISEDITHEVFYDLENMIAELDGHTYPVEWKPISEREFYLRSGTRNYHVILLESRADGSLLFQVNGKLHLVKVRDEQRQLLDKMGFDGVSDNRSMEVEAPMPGKVLQIMVEEGSQINRGDPLIILEAMKMENEIRAVTDGKISSIACRPGTSVEKHQTLITIDLHDDS